MVKQAVGRVYRLSGRSAYVLVKPLLRRYLKGSRRSYLLLHSSGRILLVRNWLGSDAWSLPGGGAHTHESLEAAATREVMEELRIAIAQSAITRLSQGVWQSGGFEFEYAIGSAAHSGAAPRKRLFEITDAQFHSFAEVPALSNLAPEIRRAIATLQATTMNE